MKKRTLIYLCMIALLAGCQQASKTNKELFDQQYEANVKACAGALVNNTGIDSLAAESICSCLLNNLFLIDSNFVRMPDDSINALLEKHRKELETLCKKQNRQTE